MIELQKNQFCCHSIPILVQHRSRARVIEVIQIEANAITTLCLYLFHVWNKGDQRTHNSPFFPELYRCITAILEKVNIYCPNIETLSNTEAVHFISLTAQLLCTAIHLFAGSYINDLGVGLDTSDEKVHRIRLEGSSLAFAGLLVERRFLSCLGDMLGDPVWVFDSLPEHEPLAKDETPTSDLLATIADVIEL